MNVRASIYWSMAQRYGAFVITFVTTVIVSRILTPTEIGIYSLAAVVMHLAATFRDFGMYEYLVQEKTVNRDTLATSLAVTLSVAVVLALALWGSSSFIAEWYAEPGLERLINLLAVNFLIIPLASQSFNMMSREMRFKELFFIHTASTTLGATVTISAALLGFSYMSAAWGTVVASVFSTIVMLIYRPRDSWLMPRFRGSGKAYRFGFFAMGSTALGNVSSVIHESIIGRVLGFHALGLFSRGYGLLSQFQGTVVAAIQRVALPAFSNARRDGESLVPGYLRATAILSGVSWPFFSVVAIQAHNLIPFLFGDQWDLAVPIVRIVAVAAAFKALSQFAHPLLAACGRPDIRMKIYGTSAVAYLFMVIGAVQVSLIAVAWAYVVLCSIQTLMFHSSVKNLIGISARTLLASVRQSLLVTIFVAATVLAIELLMSWAGAAPTVRLFSSAVVATAIFLLAMHAFAHPFWREIRSLWDSLLVRLAAFRQPNERG